MSVTKIDSQKKTVNVKNAYIVASSNTVLMSFDDDQIGYDMIHAEYVEMICLQTSIETHSAEDYFKTVNERLSKILSSCIYKVSLPKATFEEIQQSESADDFKTWESYTVSFKSEDITNESSSGEIDFLKMY